MNINQIKDVIEKYVDGLNSLDLSQIISLVHQDIRVYSMKNGDVVKLAFGTDELKNNLDFFNREYQFIYWKILDSNIKKEVSEVTIRQKIFFMEDIPEGPEAWDMNEQISKVFFKFEKSKIKNIFMIYNK